MTVSEFFEANKSRAERWHPGGLGEWSELEWAGAMAGEAGEAANAAKKLKRIDNRIANLSDDPNRQLSDRDDAVRAIVSECADTIIYALLLMARCGVEDPEAALRTTFNRTSIRYGFPELV